MAYQNVFSYHYLGVFRIHDILVWIRILLFSSLTFKTPKFKKKFFY
jgi:hypothetical protein